MPDGEFLPPFEMNCVEDVMSKKIHAAYPDRHLVHARWAHLTEPKKIHYDQGRVKCQARNLCMRGCPFRRLFQLKQFDIALGGEDRELDHSAFFSSAFHTI